MASLVLGVVGSAIGGSLLGGFSLLGATITGAQIGGAIGTLIGAEIDSALAPGTTIRRTGPRLSDVNVQASTEGAPIPRVYGRMRVSGQLLWATKFRETATTTTTGGGKGGPGVTVSETDYTYSISFAVGLCAGVATKIGRVWADGNLIDLAQFTTRFYPGDEAQGFDPLIEEIEGDGQHAGLSRPRLYRVRGHAARGVRQPHSAIAVRDDPQPFRADPDSLENRLAGVALIPGAGEFVYATDIVTADDGDGTTAPENAHNAASEADIKASLDELTALAPNLGAVSLVVGWFGSDLRCGECVIRPGVETATKNTYPETWSVDGVSRADAHVVSASDGRPAYGGTPSDASVVAAIAGSESARVCRDVLPVPVHGYSGRQHAHRSLHRRERAGRLSLARTHHLRSRAGRCRFAGQDVRGRDAGGRVLRRHHGAGGAWCCTTRSSAPMRAAWMRSSSARNCAGSTRVRDGATSYPAVAALKTLAADVRAILGPATKIGYAADWSEYNNHQTGDAPGAVLFNLDPLWSDANIDFIGIDNYMPLADWRDGTAQLDYDATNGPTTIHDRDYLTANIRGGEDYDWYYASPADRDAQIRTPITDGLGKPWVWRAKDLWSWWSNPHYDRPAGSESASPTAWTPQSKTDPVPRTGLSGDRQGRERAECLLRSRNRRKARALLFQRPARRPDPAPVPGSAFEFLERRREQSHIVRIRRPNGRYRAHVRLVLGRAAFSVLSRARRHLGRCGELCPGPLAERTPRRGATRRSGERALRGCGVLRHRRVQSLGPRHRFRRHRHDEPARCHRAAGCRLFLRRRGERRRDPLRDARTARRDCP